ncbi:MAG TPA: Spy/CpxP family protein refolding chaperone [Rhizomicrobium sp.]
MFDRLHGALHLTPGQEDSWKTFQQAYAIAPDEIARRRGASAALATLSAPQRVDQSNSLMKADLDAQEKRGAALKAFYANLSPQQQGIFDRETLPPPMDRGD